MQNGRPSGRDLQAERMLEEGERVIEEFEAQIEEEFADFERSLGEKNALTYSSTGKRFKTWRGWSGNNLIISV